jgi:UDP-N-acetylmuramyl pentapeptide phosphotransferase/UDP-N-acetylglucosamine-1-phosphate transferase
MAAVIRSTVSASTMQSGLRTRICSPRDARMPMLVARLKPRFAPFSMTVSRASAIAARRAATLASEEPLSTTMSSTGEVEERTARAAVINSGPALKLTVTTEVSPGTPGGRGGVTPSNLYCRSEEVDLTALPILPFVPFAGALVVACGVTAVLVRVAGRLELLDHPTPRSSHARVTPRGGGIGIVLGAAAGIMIAGERIPSAPAALLGGAAALALVGLADDRYRLSVGLRLALQAAAAIAVALVSGGVPRMPLPAPLDVDLGPLAIPFAVLWVMAVVNFFNFMDGIDGLAGAQAVVTGIGVAIVGWDASAALIGASVAGAAVGFLAFNWAPARIFMGDTGSLALGYTFASLPLLAPPDSRPDAVFWMAISLWLFLADPFSTLVTRMLRGDPWHTAHRDHAYQRLVRGGRSHATVSLGLACGSAALTAAAAACWPDILSGMGWGLLALAGAVTLTQAVLARPRGATVNAG